MKLLSRFAAALLAALLLCTSLPPARGTGSGEIVGYYPAWASGQGYAPRDLPASRLTQVNYAFAAIDPESCALVLEYPERDRKNLAGLRELREAHPGLRLVLSVGGWEHSRHFSDAASTARRREDFARSCLDLLRQEDLDGVDLNWEYPVSGGRPGIVHRPADRENFTLLLRAVREALDAETARTGRAYVLTATGAADPGFLDKIEPAAVSGTVDRLFLMAYDYQGPWDRRTGFNAPLSGVRSSVRAYLDRGIPAEKLVLGTPLYGYLYKGVSGGTDGLGGTFSSGEAVPYDTVVSKYLPSAACRQLHHPEESVPYLRGNGIFLSYDDAASIAEKAALARELGLGGIGFWELSQDRGAVLVESACAAFTGKDAPWYAEAVEYVRERDWMTVPAPESPVSRGDLVTALHRMEGAPAASGQPFPDIKATDLCAQSAAWAASNGIVNGYDDGTFGPGDPLTREQFAALLWRHARWRGMDTRPGADLSAFADASAVSGYALEAVSWTVAEGLLQGRGPDALAPAGTVTQAEAAAVLMRFHRSLER